MKNECPEKQQFLKICPDARCYHNGKIFKIIDGKKQYGLSFFSEERAWQWALAILYRRILDKFKE